MEGPKLVAEAEKCLKTSLFKWKPDHEGAASAFSKAAIAYKNAGKLKEARDCHERAAQSHLEVSAIFHAAKALEQVVLLCRDLDHLEEVAPLMERVANMYLQSGTPDTATQALIRSARILEPTHVDDAVKLHLRAFDVAQTDNKGRQASEALVKAGRLLLKTKQYAKAVATLKREVAYFLGEQVPPKAALAAVGLALTTITKDGETVGARNALDSVWGTCSGDGSECLELKSTFSLCEAIDEQNWEVAVRILDQPLYKHIDNEFAKLARELHRQYKQKLEQEGEKEPLTTSYEPEQEEEEVDTL